MVFVATFVTRTRTVDILRLFVVRNLSNEMNFTYMGPSMVIIDSARWSLPYFHFQLLVDDKSTAEGLFLQGVTKTELVVA